MKILLVEDEKSLASPILDFLRAEGHVCEWAKEYDLLTYLLANPGRVLTKGAISEHLYGDDIDQVDRFDFLYSQMKNLRKKLTEHGGPDYIQTVYGVGYKLTA